MADENHDDVTEPVDAEVSGSEGGSTDATVSVAPFIDDDEPVDEEAGTEPAGEGQADDAPPPAKTPKSAVGAAVATSKATSPKAKGKGDDAGDENDDASPKVTRRVVTSKRVTPKGGGSQKPSGPKKAKGKHAEDDDEGFRSARYTPPGGQGAYAQGPSPWWVPALLFGFLIIGALIIMLNYMGVFGEAQNLRLVIGLAFILAGILTSTQYR